MRGLLAGVVCLFLAGHPIGARTQPHEAGTVLRDCPNCPEMVVMPAGTFRMGSPRDRALTESETPRHEVAIGGAFAVARFEVTRGQFAAWVRETGYAGFERKGCIVLRHEDLTWVHDEARDWRDPGFPQDDNHPVVCVSWNEAKAYVEWLSKKTGKSYRLLSEAEWEYAALAGSTNPRPWREDEKAACRHANVWDETYQAKRGFPKRPDGATTNPAGKGLRTFSQGSDPFKDRRQDWYVEFHWCTDEHAYTAPVGRFLRSAFGLHDMIGNTWEWVEDCLNLGYSGAPADGSAWLTGGCDSRVLRGGSWSSVPADARAVQRIFRLKDARRSDLGFRVARTLP